VARGTLLWNPGFVPTGTTPWAIIKLCLPAQKAKFVKRKCFFFLLFSAFCLHPSAFLFLPSAFPFLPSAFILLPSFSAFCLHPSAFPFLPSAFSLLPSLKRWLRRIRCGRIKTEAPVLLQYALALGCRDNAQ